MAANVEALRTHRVVIWAKHGVMARSDVSVKRAADRVEYAETAAKYEYLNLCDGRSGEGLERRTKFARSVRRSMYNKIFSRGNYDPIQIQYSNCL